MKKICAAGMAMTALWIGLVGCGSQQHCPPPQVSVLCDLPPDGTYYTYTFAYDKDGRATLKRVPYKPVCVPSPPPPEVGIVVARQGRQRTNGRLVCCPVCPPDSTTTAMASVQAASVHHSDPRTVERTVERTAPRTTRRTSAATRQRIAQQTEAPIRDPQTPETLCQRALRLGAENRARGVQPPKPLGSYVIVNDPAHPIPYADIPKADPPAPADTRPTARPEPVSRTVTEADLFKIPESAAEPEPDFPEDMPPPLRLPDASPSGTAPDPTPAEGGEVAQTTEAAPVPAEAGDAQPPVLRDLPPVLPGGSTTQLIGSDPLPEYIPNGDMAGPTIAYMGAYAGNLTYIQNAAHGTYRDGVLTLYRVSPTTSFIGGARGHASGTVSTNAFIRDWTSGQIPYRTQAPRALVSILTETGEILARVELSRPLVEGDGLRYEARLMQGSIPDSFGDISLMIEPLE